ncbi:MAG: tetratricopeptide repeat protein [Cyanobium sp.]|jgi:tetratricopeptide (TPR) repeat protein
MLSQSGARLRPFLLSITPVIILATAGLCPPAWSFTVDDQKPVRGSTPHRSFVLVIAQQPAANSTLSAANANQLLSQAAAQFNAAEYQVAIATWSRVIDAAPNQDARNQALVGRAKSYLILSQPALALADLGKCQYEPRQTTNLGELYLLTGVTNLQMKQYNEAIKSFSRAEKFIPNVASLYSNRAVAYQSIGDTSAARADFRKSLTLQQTMSTYYNLAVLERLSGNYIACNNILSQIITRQPDYAPVYVQRGLCSALQGKHDEALTDMLKALKLDPANVDAIQQIGYSLAAKGQYAGARQALEKAASLRLAAGQIDDYQKILAAISKLPQP